MKFTFVFSILLHHSSIHKLRKLRMLCPFSLTLKCSSIAMQDRAGNKTLHVDGSSFQTLLPCLQLPEGEIGPFISLLLIV